MPNFPPVPGQPAAVSSCGVREGIFSALGTHSARRGGYSEPDPVPAARQPKQGPRGVSETQRGRSGAAHGGVHKAPPLPAQGTEGHPNHPFGVTAPCSPHPQLLGPLPPTQAQGSGHKPARGAPKSSAPSALPSMPHGTSNRVPSRSSPRPPRRPPSRRVGGPHASPSGSPRPCQGPHLTAGPAAGFPVGRARHRVVGEACGSAGTAGLIGPP